MGTGRVREPLHRLRPTDDQAPRPGLAAPHRREVVMKKATPSNTKVLNFGLVTVLVALPAMVLAYNWMT
jgi:hypothetical protein